MVVFSEKAWLRRSHLRSEGDSKIIYVLEGHRYYDTYRKGNVLRTLGQVDFITFVVKLECFLHKM